ncbi:hypothetical protein ACFXJ8_37150 [Nonomuraea sp. NPDC059194]|uniref:hypothetical protein n=1 Tax=Nonomuraea sp. NPDC059194 TaxID=3346764 RepID=UPI0036816A04
MKLWMIVAAAGALLVAGAPVAAQGHEWRVSAAAEASVWGGFGEVGAAGPDEAWVVRSGLPLMRWNGVDWQDETGLAEPYLVSSPGPGTSWRFADNPDRIEVHRFAAGRWASLPIAVGSAHVTAAAATGADDCWAAGLRFGPNGMTDVLWHWSGTAWQTVAAPYPISDFAAVSARQVWALSSPGEDKLGYEGERAASIMRWTGRAWERTVLPPIELPEGGYLELNDIAMPYPDLGYAVGAITVGGLPREAVVLRWDGASWQRLDHRTPATAYTHVATDGGSGLWLGAAHPRRPGTLVRFQDGAWSETPLSPAGTTRAEIRGLANVPGTTRMWATVEASAPAGVRQLVLTYQ